jgi:hypothetical protein
MLAEAVRRERHCLERALEAAKSPAVRTWSARGALKSCAHQQQHTVSQWPVLVYYFLQQQHTVQPRCSQLHGGRRQATAIQAQHVKRMVTPEPCMPR